MAGTSFGGLKVCFKGHENVTLGHVFGTEELSPGEMNRKLWVYLKFNEGMVIKPPKVEKPVVAEAPKTA